MPIEMIIEDLEARLKSLSIFADRYTSHSIKRLLKLICEGKVKYCEKLDKFITKE